MKITLKKTILFTFGMIIIGSSGYAVTLGEDQDSSNPSTTVSGHIKKSYTDDNKKKNFTKEVDGSITTKGLSPLGTVFDAVWSLLKKK